MELTKQQKFFYDHAGYSYDAKTQTAEDGKIECAKSLAAAETWANDNDVTYEWREDSNPDMSGIEDAREVLGCLLFQDGVILTSLWGIADPDHYYRRVVEAELALDVMK